MQDFGKAQEELVNHKPQVSDLPIILWVFFQHPKWIICLKTIETTCGWLLLSNNSEDMRFFSEFTATVNHSWLTNQTMGIDLLYDIKYLTMQLVWGTLVQQLHKLPNHHTGREQCRHRTVVLQLHLRDIKKTWIKLEAKKKLVHPSPRKSQINEFEVICHFGSSLYTIDIWGKHKLSPKWRKSQCPRKSQWLLGLCSEVLCIPLITCGHIHMFLCSLYLLLLIVFTGRSRKPHPFCSYCRNKMRARQTF